MVTLSVELNDKMCNDLGLNIQNSLWEMMKNRSVINVPSQKNETTITYKIEQGVLDKTIRVTETNFKTAEMNIFLIFWINFKNTGRIKVGFKKKFQMKKIKTMLLNVK